MSTTSISWGTRMQHDWDGATSWGSGAPTTAAKSLTGTTEVFTADIDLGTNLGANISMLIDFNGSTDNVEIAIYASPTFTSTYTGNERPFFSREVSNQDDPSDLVFQIEGYEHIRIGIQQDGATDTHDIDAIYYTPYTLDNS